MSKPPPPFPYDPLGLDVESIKRSIYNRLMYNVGKDRLTATPRDWLNTLTYVVRDRLIERWMQTMRSYYKEDTKRVYYLSLEFLIGRTLMNSLLNMGFAEAFQQAVSEVGLDLEELCQLEADAALGNGGLGRLAACFLDSMATLQIPGYGYGIRYEYGMFSQRIEHGAQVEHPDSWLRYGNSWEFPRSEVLYPIHFYGHIVEYRNKEGPLRYHWVDTEQVMAMAFDTPIPGYGNETVNNMRLWSAKATRDFDLGYFNEGNYIESVAQKSHSETLSRVLYPDDTTSMGKELRLKQEYFFVSASLQDILFRYIKHHHNFDQLPDKVAIQLNDTHPAIAIPELMRILVDEKHLSWNHAWQLTVRTFSYTNHTLMPEALETWEIDLFAKVLPRHLQIIYDINYFFLRDVMHQHPGDSALFRRISIIDEQGGKKIRMAHLAIVGSHKVNGVAQLHTELMRSTIFADFNDFFPHKIINVTNGITPRRWLNQANPKLAQLLCRHIKSKWATDLGQLKQIIHLATDPDFQHDFRVVKQQNKDHLAKVILQKTDIQVDASTLFDVHIKRIHEYKRQLLNILHIIRLYQRIRQNTTPLGNPRTFIFAGKAAPGYEMAKLIVHLIVDVADIINHDPAVNGQIKVVFIPNYDVSMAEIIIPAAELSEQISTAGTEASGTGNMKLALNGALTIGTLDGANIEIREEVGEDNIFIFGLTSQQVITLRESGYQAALYYQENAQLATALEMIGQGFFSPSEPKRYQAIYDSLLAEGGDHYLLLADYASYCETQEQVDQLYSNSSEWTRKAILNTANMGIFSSDRTITEYAKKIWQLPI